MSLWGSFSRCSRCTHFAHDGYECSQFGCDCRVAVRCVECGKSCHAGELDANGICCAAVGGTNP